MPKQGEKKKDGKTVQKTFRFKPKDWNRIRGLADHYAKGNATKWVTHGALNGERKFLE